MKKLLLTVIALFAVVTLTYAQKAVKGSSMKAETLLKAGKLDEAKTEIENALTYELAKLKKKGKKEIGKGKTYSVQGQVYQAIATKEGVDKKTRHEAIKKAMAAYAKVKEVEKENSVIYIQTFTGLGAPSHVTAFYGTFTNTGIDKYNEQDMAGAIEQFENALLVMPKDTASGLNIFVSAQKSDNEAKSIEYARKLISWKYTKPHLYNYLANVALQKEDFDEALKIMEDGMTANPGNINMMGTKINIYIKAGKADDAVKSIDAALKKEPNNYSMWLNKGLLTRDLGKLDDAESALNKALELKPTEVELYKELSGIFYNAARAKKKDRDALPTTPIGIPLDQAKDDALKKEELALYKRAIPYSEKYFEKFPTDRKSVELLEYLYFKLKMSDKADKMSEILETLPE